MDGRLRSPNLSESMRLKLHAYRERTRLLNSVRTPGGESWNNVLHDYEREVIKKKGKLRRRKGQLRMHDQEEIIRFWRENKARYDQMDEDRRNEINYHHRQTWKAENRWRVEHGRAPKEIPKYLCRKLCEYLNSK